MITRLLFLLSAFALSGCVEVSRYSMQPTAIGYAVLLRRDFNGVSLGMCGPMTGAYLTRELWFSKKKAYYEAKEVRSRHDGNFDPTRFTDGFVKIDTDHSVVEIRLRTNNVEYDLNGRFMLQKPKP